MVLKRGGLRGAVCAALDAAVERGQRATELVHTSDGLIDILFYADAGGVERSGKAAELACDPFGRRQKRIARRAGGGIGRDVLRGVVEGGHPPAQPLCAVVEIGLDLGKTALPRLSPAIKTGRASWRARVCQSG